MTTPRCSVCFQPAKVTKAGAATPHSYPYAADTYGQCKGSGKQPLPGTATPPAVWTTDSGRDYVQLGVLPSPLPQVERDGWTATISGVRFTHQFQCPMCRKFLLRASDGGSIRIGFDSRGRSFETLRPGRPDPYQGPCLYGCGRQIDTRASWSRRGDGPEGRPVADGWTAVSREWERLRGELDVWGADMTPADLNRLRSVSR